MNVVGNVDKERDDMTDVKILGEELQINLLADVGIIRFVLPG